MDERCHHTAVAIGDADVCRIPRDVGLKLDQANPSVHQPLMQRWQGSVDQADHFIVSLSTGPAEVRIARLLIALGHTGSQPESRMPSREEMGARVGITTETAGRVMAQLKRRGLMRSGQNGHFMCDKTGLVHLAQA